MHPNTVLISVGVQKSNPTVWSPFKGLDSLKKVLYLDKMFRGVYGFANIFKAFLKNFYHFFSSSSYKSHFKF